MSDIRSDCSTFRTRNAGAFLVSADMVFRTEEAYRSWRDSGAVTAEAVAALLRVDPATVQVIDYPAANAIKVTMPRRTVAGGPDDTDLDSAAQFVPLLSLRRP
ncbi:DUF4387 family protein [Dactylosporangium sp. CA-052675]|uniref:DUF4387 family protein n=1 Tax=Dactylosporangium sp. CA-052675 TaxID=3239927 RepID=UPI003D8BF539